MFTGTCTPKLDDKGRFFLPAEYRGELGAGMVITRQHERCLVIWPTEAFRANVEAQIQTMSPPEVRTYQRMVASAASNKAADSQGRVTIPPELREYAGLAKDLAVVGSYDHVEVWDLVAWKNFLAENEGTFAGDGQRRAG